MSGKGSLPRASYVDSAAFAAGVAIPTIAKGAIIRRPKVVGLAESLDLDQRAVKRMQGLRQRYGDGPLLVRNPVRPQAVLLAPDDVHRVLNGSPEPFATASSEKRAALAHFEPKASLISHGPERTIRRRFNEQVLETGHPVHRLGASFIKVVDQEAAQLVDAARRRGELNWQMFADPWFRMVRRIVLGEGASGDLKLSEMLAELRSDANWSFMKPKREGLRERFQERLRQHLARGEEGSLAGAIAAIPTSSTMAPEHQVPQYLFAFDPAGMASYRALALLASHPNKAERARTEISAPGEGGRQMMPFLRACLLESLRLWPTTPMVLRQTTEETEWANGLMPQGTGILIFAPFFHRDDQRLSFANSFVPEMWLEDRPANGWPLIPFSSGPAACPARHLVPMIASVMIGRLVQALNLRLKEPGRLDPSRPLPGTLDNYRLGFEVGT